MISRPLARASLVFAVLASAGCHLAFPHAPAERPDQGRLPSRDAAHEPRADRRADGTPPCTFCVVTLAGTSAGFEDGPVSVARFEGPTAVALGAPGEVIVADSGNHRIRVVAAGQVKTLGGSGVAGYLDGAAAEARFSSPEGVATRGGLVVIADTGNHRLRTIRDGSVSTLAGSGIAGYSDGSVYTAQFSSPAGVTIDGWGTIYVADRGSGRIRKIAGGWVSTVASGLDEPTGVAVDSVGTVIVAERGGHRIRILQGAGMQTLAGSQSGYTEGAAGQARFAEPSGLAVAPDAVLVADRRNHRIRRIADGAVSTFAGSGAAGSDDGALFLATFQEPVALARDLVGRLYVVDQGDHRVRLIILDR